MQIQDHSQIQPTLARPNIADVTSPFLVRVLGCKVPVQQVRCDIELVIAVRRDLVFARSHNGYAVLAHQTAHTAVPNIQTNLFQLFCHSWATVAAETETELFFDVRQCHHIRSLPAAGWPTAERTQAAHANIHSLTQARGRKRFPVFFDEPKPHGFWLAKNCVAFFRMSRSSLRMRTSRRSRSFSWASPKSSFDTTSVSRCAVIHLFSVDMPTDKSSATCLRVSPLVSAMRTASLRNSSVRFSPIVRLLCCSKCYQRGGIKP